ncbi:MAG TPA: beta-aspartyl-peptidase [Salinivirga sp.]|uniref:beta-aspartyl-peptidase n=1 Tax=Salinivirga sp. TaxID=1970192 RepID=UPI002B46DF3E|nr:beta-aspartyl-peptidase [Salinivirga sp.]HKK60710.1 beta-aspartyl-peptidase [Salinivirga sp.]
MILIKNAEVFAPEATGIKDVLVAGGKIIAIEDEITTGSLDAEVIDAHGLKLTPGFIDAHVHIAGAGGEGGPATRTPEIPLSQLLEAGVTTVIGCLGTDGMTRSIESVLMKVKALRNEGMSAWMYSGAYQVPTPTLTGDVGRDVALLDEVIGIGEIALSDHRSSTPTTPELIKLAAHARVGGMLGGKAGIVNIHMGDAKNPFRPIYDAIEQSELPIKQFYPTHCNRNDYIFEDAKVYGKKGWVDITTSSYPYFKEYEIKPSKAVSELLKAGVPEHHITFTSDANGSLPDFDEQGNLVKLEKGLPMANLTELRDTVLDEKVPLDVALKVLTSNPASALKLNQKGKIALNADADLLLMNEKLELKHVISKGKLIMKNGDLLVKGSYE